MDKILIHGLQLMACHGVLPKEQVTPQPFVIDVSMCVDLHRAGETDELEHTVNYAEAVEWIRHTVCDTQNQLIERVATRIAQTLLRQYPLTEVTVRVHKPQAPVEATFDDMAVEITRRREELL